MYKRQGDSIVIRCGDDGTDEIPILSDEVPLTCDEVGEYNKILSINGSTSILNFRYWWSVMLSTSDSRLSKNIFLGLSAVSGTAICWLQKSMKALSVGVIAGWLFLFLAVLFVFGFTNTNVGWDWIVVDTDGEGAEAGWDALDELLVSCLLYTSRCV